MIGKTVTVTIDRPLGSSHPRFPDLIYPINYGFVEGIIAPDGEYQDAYVLGIESPIESFAGVIIAIVHRLNDVEDKWVVAPKNVAFTKDEIEKAIRFQEKYFEYEIVM